MQRKGTIALLACLLIAVTVAQGPGKGGFCPLVRTISNCTPKCISDFQCGFNEKCCPNACGSTSCASPSAVSTGNNDKGRTQNVYCAGVTCRQYEKCEFDRKTKREKCVRK